ncbi:hypothetical protein EVAR_95827_1 [Eumeta japonica]|uniref:Uncharacterized protein n=1 Tax=Eumeta variegata TaxID=151549 RepID=A0A4C1VK60_EUMVA|nr:hypothetical protein EVAR_95827_1 [Eumeta japonica]
MASPPAPATPFEVRLFQSDWFDVVEVDVITGTDMKWQRVWATYGVYEVWTKYRSLTIRMARRLKHTWHVERDQRPPAIQSELSSSNMPKLDEGSAHNHSPDSEVKAALNLALLLASHGFL